MSTLKVNSIQAANAGSEDYFLARAWVNFNGTGTVAIRAGGNVSSITDNGTGQYTVNFSSAIADANYACSVAYDLAVGVTVIWVNTYLTTSVKAFSYRTDVGSYADNSTYCLEAVR